MASSFAVHILVYIFLRDCCVKIVNLFQDDWRADTGVSVQALRGFEAWGWRWGVWTNRPAGSRLAAARWPRSMIAGLGGSVGYRPRRVGIVLGGVSGTVGSLALDLTGSSFVAPVF